MAPEAYLDSAWRNPAPSPGNLAEVRCTLPVSIARARYRARTGKRHPGHLDGERSGNELWGGPSRPLGLGPVIEVDTSAPVDITRVAARLREVIASR